MKEEYESEIFYLEQKVQNLNYDRDLLQNQINLIKINMESIFDDNVSVIESIRNESNKEIKELREKIKELESSKMEEMHHAGKKYFEQENQSFE